MAKKKAAGKTAVALVEDPQEKPIERRMVEDEIRYCPWDNAVELGVVTQEQYDAWWVNLRNGSPTRGLEWDFQQMMSRDILEFATNLKRIHEIFKDKYESIRIQVDEQYDYECNTLDYMLYGRRWETDAEYETRKSRVLQQRAAAARRKAKKERELAKKEQKQEDNKNDPQYQEYLNLKKKYEE